MLSLAAGAVLLMLGTAIWYSTGERYVAKTAVVIPGAMFVLVAGSGGPSAASLAIAGIPEDGRGVAVSPQLLFGARQFARVAIHADGLEGKRIGIFLADQNRPLAARGLRFSDSGIAVIDLPADLPQAVKIGFTVTGDFTTPMTVRGIRLIPALPGIGGLISEMVEQWTGLDPWDGRSINFIGGTVREDLLPAVPAAALWIVLSAAVYLAVGGLVGWSRTLVALLVIVMAGWLALDLKWLWNLSAQFTETYGRFATVEPARRREARMGVLAGDIERLEGQMPDGGRLLIVALDENAEKAKFTALSARYVLLPRNALAVWDEKAARRKISRLAAGDQVLLLDPSGRFDFRAPGAKAVREVSRSGAAALWTVGG